MFIERYGTGQKLHPVAFSCDDLWSSFADQRFCVSSSCAIVLTKYCVFVSCFLFLIFWHAFLYSLISCSLHSLHYLFRVFPYAKTEWSHISALVFSETSIRKVNKIIVVECLANVRYNFWLISINLGNVERRHVALCCGAGGGGGGGGGGKPPEVKVSFIGVQMTFGL